MGFGDVGGASLGRAPRVATSAEAADGTVEGQTADEGAEDENDQDYGSVSPGARRRLGQRRAPHAGAGVASVQAQRGSRQMGEA